MKALSINQLWAWAIVHGPKRVENRTWATTHRGPLAIHAGLREWPGSREALEAMGLDVPQDCPRGAIVGLVDLVDVVAFDPQAPALFDPYGLARDPFASGPRCWILANPRPLPEPIPYTGRQGLFEIPLAEDELFGGSRRA